MKKIISLFILISLFTSPVCFAGDFDMSVDDSIRKDYINESNLPPLPKVTPGNSIEIPVEPKAEQKKSDTKVQTVYKSTGKSYKLKSGTKISLVSKTAISDTMQRGAKVSFVSQNPFNTAEGVTVPTGTLFKGTITDSHTPQITGNGGLVELKIDEIYFNGAPSKIETKLSDAASRKVYGGDIKGKRSYWKNFGKAMTPGRKFYKATNDCAHVLLPIPVVNILSIVPWALGTVFYAVNLTVSPVIALFTKGGSLRIPAGTQFTIKTTKDIQING